MASHVNGKYSRRHVRQVQREHFAEFRVGHRTGERRGRWNCDRDYIISCSGFSDQRKRTRSPVVVMVNCGPMTVPLPVNVGRNWVDVKGKRLTLKREKRQCREAS